MIRSNSTRRLRGPACLLATGIMAVLLNGATGWAQQPPGGAAPPSAPPPGAAWLMSGDGGMPWPVAAMFTGFWVLMAAEVAIISKSAGRLDKPKKKDQYQEAE